VTGFRNRRTTAILALCCGITASNVYLIQPIAVAVARHFGVTDDAAGLLASALQISYALGIVLFVPIIDRLPARLLLTPLVTASTVCLAVMATVPSWPVFCAAGCLLGLVCPIPQIIIPAAVEQADDGDGRGGAALVGTLQAGLLFGLLGARFYAGAIATAISVPVVFAVSAVLTAVAGALAVPALRGHAGAGVGAPAIPGVAFIRGLPLLARPPRLVLAVCVSGLAIGVAFGMFWNSLTFLGDRWYHLTAAQIGLFGLVAGVSGLVSPMAGRLASRWGATRVQVLACALVIVGWLSLLAGARGVGIAVVATVLIDVGVWSNQVINQATAFADPTVPRGLANTYYFGTRFLGISLGSALGSWLFLTGRWTAAVLIACAVTGVGLAVFPRLRPSPLFTI
jgi:predicted MFS family arabinose efflux permease